MTCQALPAGAGFISSMTSYVDCQAQILGSGAWQVLAAPGSTLSIVLAGFLTIFIALIGYNLLLGHNLTVRSGTLAFVKIGAVLALATSWPAYRTLVFDLVIDGPVQLVAEIGPQTGVVGSDGTMLQRLDLTDQALSQLALLGPGRGPVVQQVPPPPWAGFNTFALGGSRILFLMTVIGGFGAVRIVTGLMLALGPFFVAFLMFDSTRGLFEGWVRVLAGSALAAISLSIVLGLELGLMEPWISDVLARRMTGEVLPTVPTELFVVTTLFGIIAIAAIIGCARVARAFRLPSPMQLLPVPESSSANMQKAEPMDRGNLPYPIEREGSRAAAIANVLVATNRLEGRRIGIEGGGLAMSARRSPTVHLTNGHALRTITPIGRSFSRRTGSRVSAGAKRRDAAA